MLEDVVEDMLEDMVKDVVEDVVEDMVEDVVGGCVPGTRRRTFESFQLNLCLQKFSFYFLLAIFPFFQRLYFGAARPPWIFFFFRILLIHWCIHGPIESNALDIRAATMGRVYLIDIYITEADSPGTDGLTIQMTITFLKKQTV